MVTIKANLEASYSFTYNFLVGAVAMAQQAFEIENADQINVPITDILRHKSYITGSIMQSVAALESEIWNILNHGPGYHLGSNKIDQKAKEVLSIVVNIFERESLIKKYDLILQLIRQKKIDIGNPLIQDLKLVIGLRNEITHYKSLFTKELERKKLFKTLQEKYSAPPKFYHDKSVNFFPHICLSAERAKWSLNTVISFINFYYNELEIESPLLGYNQELLEI